MSQLIRTYTELSKLKTFGERYRYLRLEGKIGAVTFGRDRWLNQIFYNNYEWKERIRKEVLLRDMGCDLGVHGYEFGPNQRIIIHHMNPIQLEDLQYNIDLCLNPEYLITTSIDTHNAIHYSRELVAPDEIVIRTPNDTCPWRH